MSFFIFLFAIILAFANSGSSGSYSSGNSYDYGDVFNSSSPRNQKSSDDFEEADSFFDRDGNEHIVDDDGYCEDCDDYHDDY